MPCLVRFIIHNNAQQELSSEKTDIERERGTLKAQLHELYAENTMLKKRELFLTQLCRLHNVAL